MNKGKQKVNSPLWTAINTKPARQNVHFLEKLEKSTFTIIALEVPNPGADENA